MSDPDLTQEERNYVERLAREPRGLGRRVGFYASIIVPMVLFAAYGVAQFDFVAELIAFIGLLIFLLWRISDVFTHLPVARSTLAKVAEHERRADASAG